jgi:hypothetical protein
MPKGGTSLDVGRRVLDIEARAVQALVQRLDSGFSDAVDLLYQCKGKVVVSGMGKSALRWPVPGLRRSFSIQPKGSMATSACWREAMCS